MGKEQQDVGGKEIGMFDIQEELKKLPGRPGVYLMHDEKDEIISVSYTHLDVYKRQHLWWIRMPR